MGNKRNSSLTTIIMILMILVLIFLLYRVSGGNLLAVFNWSGFSSRGGPLDWITSSLRSVSDSMVRLFSNMWH